MSKKQYPIEDGWLHATFTMKSKAIVDPKEIKEFCSGGNPESHEFAVIEQNGAKVKVIFRKKAKALEKEKAAA